MPNAQVAAPTGAYDAARKGFVIAFTIDEGDQYRFGAIDIKSNIGEVDVAALRAALTMSTGDVYDASIVDKSVDALAFAVSRQGFPFATVHPHAQRDHQLKPSISSLRSMTGRTPTSSASSCVATPPPRIR
jgi:outer membrane protein insertion porin family